MSVQYDVGQLNVKQTAIMKQSNVKCYNVHNHMRNSLAKNLVISTRPTECSVLANMWAVITQLSFQLLHFEEKQINTH